MIPAVLAVAGVLAPVACSRTDDAAPVATVSVTNDRARRPIGSPLEITYRFQVGEDAIDGDYTVFVHLVNADGQQIWNDDHAPSVPTSQWKPGETIEYTRTRFLPALLHPGDATLEVGLYRDGERLPLAAGRQPRSPGSRAYPVADLQLAPEAENVFVIFQSGWYPDDFVPGEPTSSSRWTQQSATLTFRHPRTDATLLVEYAGRPNAFDTPQQLTIVGTGNEPIATFPVDSDALVLRRIPVTSAQMGTGDMAELRLDVDRTFVPAELGTGERDTRALGIRVYNVFVESR